MNVRTLKDSVGAVFSPKVSADSVYLSGSETNLTTKLNNIDSHTGNSDIHITSSEKTSWNNKYDKPSSGIPKTDLASGVQTSLGKADTAWQNPSSTTTTINGTLFFNGGDQNGASKIHLGANGQITRENNTLFGFQNSNRLDVGSPNYPVNIRTNSLTYNGNNFVSSTTPTANWGETVTVGTVAGTNLKFVMPANPSSGGNYLPLSGGTVTGATSFTNTTASTSTSTGAVKISGGLGVAGHIYAGAVHNAVWNDLVDSIPVDEECILEYGCCYCFDGKKYTKSSKYLDEGIIGIYSDTYGFKMGSEEDKKKIDVAVAGFVLAYVDKEYPVGTPLTCTENGYLTEIKKEDKIEYPERIVATYWKNEPAEEWGTKDRKVKVNGRKWVKIK